MRCSPKLCIGLILVGIGGVALFAYTGNAKAAYALSFLAILVCPLMCIVMMMIGHKCEGNECQTGKKRNSVSGKRF